MERRRRDVQFSSAGFPQHFITSLSRWVRVPGLRLKKLNYFVAMLGERLRGSSEIRLAAAVI